MNDTSGHISMNRPPLTSLEKSTTTIKNMLEVSVYFYAVFILKCCNLIAINDLNICKNYVEKNPRL
jgi:hypothetical protein